ncbi:MAG: carboxypeptidase regulatory-like domain-containing protein [Thermodesulfobacteriota bacterium]
MRKVLSLSLLALFLAFPLLAQVRTGNIYGKVIDDKGESLPGVNVTLTGRLTAPTTYVSSSAGLFRFLSLSPAKDYVLKAELQGFKTTIQENIGIELGGNVDITLVMTPGALLETVTVIAEKPIDTRKVSVGMQITTDYMQEIPSARDPWVFMEMAPGVSIDRENIGGNESGHQSLFAAKGGAGRDQNIYTMDGVEITASFSPGSSPIYYDVDAYEEMNITTGGADVTARTAGVALNLVTKRGGNKLAIGGRYYLTDKNFQASNISPALQAEGLPGTNKIVRNQDYGFNIGFPILKDKAWLWGSYGVTDIKDTTIYAQPDNTTLTNITVKLNLQIIPSNRFEVLMSGNEKYKFGGGQSPENPGGIIQEPAYDFGVPLLKIQDEHMFGDNLLLSAKYSWMDNTGGNVSVLDPTQTHLAIKDVTTGVYSNSYSYGGGVNKDMTLGLTANYFNDKLFGVHHEIKVGVDYQKHSAAPYGGFSGNIHVYDNFNIPTVDFDGSGTPQVPTDPNFKEFFMSRPGTSSYGTHQFAAFLSDTISAGRLNFLLGLRFDRQTPYMDAYTVTAMNGNPAWTNNVDSQTIQVLNNFLPPISVPAQPTLAADGSKYNWTTWSPRLGVTWDIAGNGKTIAKLSLASYGDYMPNYEGQFWQRGGTSGYDNFWWWDKNGDGIVNYQELYWNTISNYALYHAFDNSGNFIGNYADAAGVFWGDYDPQNPTQTTAPYMLVANNAGSSRTYEAMLSLERQILPDFSILINGTFRRYTDFNWYLKYFPDTGDIQNASWYISAGTAPANIPGIGSTQGAGTHNWYYISSEGTAYSPWTYVQRQPDAHNDYWGLDLVATKRLSNKWMLNASFTIQTQAAHFGKNGILNSDSTVYTYLPGDPTNNWAYEGSTYSPSFGGGSGKIDQYIYTPWMFKVAGLYQFPYGINISATMVARPGYIQDESLSIVDYRLPNPLSNGNYLEMVRFGSERLPTIFLMNLRLEKMLKLGDTGRIYLMADAFNLLNSGTVNRREQKYHGTYYIYPDSSQNIFVPNPTYDQLNEILNPRVVRFGLRFQF